MHKNEQTFLAPFMALRKSIAHYISRIVPPADVEDIVQDTYVKLCSIEDKDPTKYNKSFLYTMAKNLALDHVKKADNKLTDKVEDESEFHVEDSDKLYNEAVTNEKFAHFCKVVQQMPSQSRKIFVLRKVYGFSQKEIAEQLDISVNTVSNQLVNGMKQFSKLEQSFATETNPVDQQVKRGG
ncbi:RNA polymerase sigma factor [Catenovulum adriaticum]|uniref:Sigma-70 family RNA polymerase sigma factor n=1 Tax=Catenovulum adriaticum TaxID=2984846 RepID=A0ABY7ARN0_9ALTE|nr:sigma-70 family RNA polymerase sigma factor [Catenovulum sp. TS8]WAJ71781.1 sigma-70 family RNA polymerase sigma factor [Catenovulum sp. TS8]